MRLTTIDEVQDRVGKLPAPRDLKVIDHIDAHAGRWLSYAHFGFFCHGSPGALGLSALGGEMGVLEVNDKNTLALPLAALDKPEGVEAGQSFGALLLVSGVEETLRVNGRIHEVTGGTARLRVMECYLHCAKAFKRSGFWSADPVHDSPVDVPAFLNRARFLALASISSDGQADVSPKGDPAHLLLQQDGDAICFADRPGNRRIDSFRNIVQQPHVSLLAMVPGSDCIAEINGAAELCVDEPLMERFAVGNKVPSLIARVRPDSLRLLHSDAVTRSRLWPAGEGPADINPAEIFKAHIRHSGDKTLPARLARAAVALPGAMKKGLESDYKKNLY